MTLRARLACEEDVEAIMKIIKAVVPLMQASGNFQWDEIYPSEAVIREDIAKSQCYVVERELDEKANAIDGLLGFTALTEDQSPEYADAGWDLTIPAIVPHRMAVSPEARRQGVAAFMYAHSEVLARKRGYDRVRVDTNKVNGPMNSTIQNAGFKLAGEINLSTKPKDMKFNCYEKILL